jgi:hypothetical protein
MPASLRPLTTGQLLDRTFQVYRQNFMLFVGIAAVPEVVLLLAQLGLLGAIGTHTSAIKGAIIAVAGSLLVIVVSLMTSAIATSATTFAVSDIYLENPTSVSACFSRVKGKIGRVIITSIGYGLLVGIGLVLLIVPGIYWAGKYGLSVPSVVLEDNSPGEAFSRSSKLTEYSVSRIIVIYFLTWILMVVVAAGLGMVAALAVPTLSKTAGTMSAAAFQHLVNAVVSVCVTPVMAIALTLAYYDQRVRKEAFDIESLMSLLGEPGAASANTNALGASS